MNETARRSLGIVIYLAVCLFSISGQISTNSLWISLPVLTSYSPEGATLSLYFLTLLECANVATIAYLGVRKCSRRSISEVPFIYGCFALGLTSLLLVAFFWDSHIQIMGESYSFVLLICVFFASIVSCMSRVTFIPFIARLREGYISAAILGEALSALFPLVLGVVQGIGVEPNCTVAKPVYASLDDNSTRPLYRQPPYLRTTLPPTLPPAVTRFPVYGFFLVIAAVFSLGAACFVLLRCFNVCQLEYVDTSIEHMDGGPDVGHPGGVEMEDTGDDVWQTHCDGMATYYLEDGTIRHGDVPQQGNVVVHRSPVLDHQQDRANQTSAPPPPPPPPSQQQHRSPQQAANRFANPPPSTPVSRLANRSRMTSSASAATKFSETSTMHTVDSIHPRNFTLLMVITLWTSSVTHGPLSPVLAYACYPIGNHAFLIGGILSYLLAMGACPVAVRLAARSQITIVIALTALGTILLTYFTALISFSHSTPSRDSPIFGKNGEMLATVTWVAIMALFSFAKMTISVVCRKAHSESVIYFSILSQAGAAIGALSVIRDFSICRVFQADGPFTCSNK